VTLDTAAATAFIDSYRRTFEAFDVDAICGAFGFPVQVIGDAGPAGDVGVVAVPAVEAWRPQVERIVGAYRVLGVASATVESLAITEVTPRIAHATVRWGLHGADGGTIYAFTASYTLTETADGPRIVGIAHDETPKLAAAVARARGG
jgi:hypothetical protein